MQSVPSIGIVAGEASGDLIASRLIHAIAQAQFTGIGGAHMQAQANFHQLYSMDALSVFGYVDAFKHLPGILQRYFGAKRHFFNNPPDVFVGIDAPDFNFVLESALKSKGIPTVHYVSPSIWAWRYERIHKIRQAVSHMLVLFPFEVEIYEKEGIPVTFVGHPLASQIPFQSDATISRQRLGLPVDVPVLAILPGSRKSELNLLAHDFLATAYALQQAYPHLHFVIPMTSESREQQLRQVVQQYPLKNLHIYRQAVSDWPISWDCMQACDAALVASGTASLELALFQKPMVIAYRLSPLMVRIMAWKSGQSKPNIPWIGLPNILSQRFVVPEFLQEQVTPTVLQPALEQALFDPTYRATVQADLQAIHRLLCQDTATLSRQAIMEVLNG